MRATNSGAANPALAATLRAAPSLRTARRHQESAGRGRFRTSRCVVSLVRTLTAWIEEVAPPYSRRTNEMLWAPGNCSKIHARLCSGKDGERCESVLAEGFSQCP